MQTVSIKLHRRHAGAVVPAYAHAGDAGFDLCFAGDTSLTLEPGAHRLVPTGLAMEIPGGFEVQVRPRSGLAAKQGVTVLNAPGTIDSGYRGEVQVCLINLGREPVTLEPGQRIAQGVVAPVTAARFEVVEELAPSSRGAGGFGSTGA